MGAGEIVSIEADGDGWTEITIKAADGTEVLIVGRVKRVTEPAAVEYDYKPSRPVRAGDAVEIRAPKGATHPQQKYARYVGQCGVAEQRTTSGSWWVRQRDGSCAGASSFPPEWLKIISRLKATPAVPTITPASDNLTVTCTSAEDLGITETVRRAILNAVHTLGGAWVLFGNRSAAVYPAGSIAVIPAERGPIEADPATVLKAMQANGEGFVAPPFGPPLSDKELDGHRHHYSFFEQGPHGGLVRRLIATIDALKQDTEQEFDCA